MAKKKNKNSESFEKTLFKAADKLRKNIDAAEYKHIVLGLIFLKYISDSFEALHSKLIAGLGEYKGADPEDADEYKAENVFFVHPYARWSYLQNRAKLPSIGKDVDDAMVAIEKANPDLKGYLPKRYALPNLDKTSLGGLIDLIGNIPIVDEAEKIKDLLGNVYEYFLGQFADAEGKKGGQFYTPKSIVRLMVEMIEPYKGRVFDPCCGSGGMFVMSDKFVREHQGRLDDIIIYGQESNQTTYHLCKMNLGIRGIDSSQVKWNNEGSFLNDAHKDLKTDFILANPPFNDSDWSGELLQKDARWKYGIPPAGNANYAWMQHMIYHLAPNGVAAFLLGNAAISSVSNNEDVIRNNIVDNDLVECIVSLPNKLFYNTQLPVTVWILARNKKANKRYIDRSGKILFIDGERLGYFKDKQHRFFTDKDISRIATAYKAWRKGIDYKDIAGFCKEATLEEIKKKNYILVPARFIERTEVEKQDNELKVLLTQVVNDHAKADILLNKLQQQIEKLNNLPNYELEALPLGCYCRLQIGGVWGDNQFFEDSVQAYSLRGVDLSNLKNYGRAQIPLRYLKRNSLQKRKLDECDIVIGGSGIGPIGKTLWISKQLLESLDYPLSFSNFCKRLRCECAEIAAFFDLVFSDLYESGELKQFFIGTSIPNLDIKNLLELNVLVPPKEIIIKIGEAVKISSDLKALKAAEFDRVVNIQKDIYAKTKS